MSVVKAKGPKPKPEQDDITLAQRIIYKARVASASGHKDIALALYDLIAEHFDWGEGGAQLLSDGKGLADSSTE